MREKRFRRLREQDYFNRPIRRNAVPTKWWSDPPKLVPIVISVFALTVSILSWIESHKGRLINEEINRPVLSLSKPTVKREIGSWVKENEARLWFSGLLNNTGKSRAQIQLLKIEIEPSLLIQRCDVRHPIELGAEYEDLLPGQEMFISTLVSYSASDTCDLSLSPMFFDITVDVGYTDPATGNQYIQKLYTTVEVDMMDKKEEKSPTPDSSDKDKQQKK